MIERLSADLCRRLQRRELAGRTVGIKVRLDDWTTVTRARTLDDPVNDVAVVMGTPANQTMLRNVRANRTRISGDPAPRSRSTPSSTACVVLLVMD